MEQEIARIETGLKNAFAGLPVHSIDLLVNTPTEWTDLMQPHRYKWVVGKLHRVTYDLSDNGKQILNEVPEAQGEFIDRIAILEAENAALVAALDSLVNHIGNTQFTYKLYLESKDSANSFNLSKSIGELGRAKTKCKKEFLEIPTNTENEEVQL